MAWQKLKIVSFTLAVVVVSSCAPKQQGGGRASVKDRKSAQAESSTLVISSGEGAKIETANTEVIIPQGSFPRAAIESTEINSSEFAAKSKISDALANKAIGPALSFEARDAAGTPITTPNAALKISLAIPSSSMPSTYVVVIADKDHPEHIAYVPSDDLIVSKNNATGLTTITVGKLLSGNFVLSVLSIGASDPLLSSIRPLNSDGSFPALPGEGSTGVPAVSAGALAFSDLDSQSGVIQGTLSIGAASSESTVSSYVIYFGSNATTKISSTPAATIPANGSATYYGVFSSPTAISHSTAYFLVYTANRYGESATPVAIEIVDAGVPFGLVGAIGFSDTDDTPGEIAGTLTIQKSPSEANITHYAIYWGVNSTTKVNSTPIATIAKTGSNLSYVFSADTVIPTSPSAHYILVYPLNSYGEGATPSAYQIIDLQVPNVGASSVSFTDTDLDANEISGTITIGSASSEQLVSQYVVYWGSNSTTKQNSTPIATIDASGIAQYQVSIGANTSIPSSPTATHILVYTKNSAGESTSPVATALVDKVAPTITAAGVSMTDTDDTAGELAGVLTITKAANESSLTNYVVYWGSNASTKQNVTPITSIAKTGANVSYTFAANTVIPTSPAATHILVYTANADGEATTPIAYAIVDAKPPVHPAASVTFSDTDGTNGEIAGTVTITPASDESDITHYVLYWGSNSTTKQNATPLANIAKQGGAAVTYTIAADTAIPSSPAATHLLVFTKNAHGEMSTGVNVSITDAAVPSVSAAGINFTDTDPDAYEIQGTLNITKAANESTITHYRLYWGSDATTKQNATAITTIAANGSNLTYNFAANTSIPSAPSATHFLVYTVNAAGEASSPVAVAIVDLQPPTNAAASLSFTDTDLDGGQLGGVITISKASSETDVTQYKVYWGSNATTKQNATPIATVNATGAATYTVNLSNDTAIPSSPTATHILVFSANSAGEMSTGVSTAISDKAVPSVTAGGLSFTDTDTTAGEIAGVLNITKAANESTLTNYVVYWGSNSTTKQSPTPIASIAKTGSNLTYTFASNTAIPTSPAATNILVFTANADGEASTPIAYTIVDVKPPVHTAASVTFTDTDGTSGEIAGTVTINPASDESDITHYVLYWGSNSTTKQNSTPIAIIAKQGGAAVTYSIAADTVIPTSPSATHLLVFTKNTNGEMSNGVNVAISDSAVPTAAAGGLSFTDSDPDANEIQGTLTITKAADESNITHYRVYWGSNATTKQNGTEITTIAANGSNLTYNFAANTPIPSAPTATHLLVYTVNTTGESSSPVALAIVDTRPPTNAAVSLTFTDTDLDGGQLGGLITISKASSETDVTQYKVYWGSNSTTKQNATPIATVAATGAATYSVSLSNDTAIPSSPAATHFLVFTANAAGEMSTGVSHAFTDKGVPTHAAVSLGFTDTDTSANNVAGTLAITKAADESDITHYVIYWGSNSTTKQNSAPIATVAKTGATPINYSVSSVSIPTSPTATHFLVFTKNSDGEMSTGVSVAIHDVGVPTHTPGGISTSGDADLDPGQYQATITITKASSETDITNYVLYWGSNSTSKQSGTPIATIPVTGSNVTYNIPSNTVIPTSPAASHLLAYSANTDGENSTPVAVAISDLGVPTHSSGSLSFTDSDTNSGEIAGNLTITKASDESDVTHYVLYWGSDASTKQSATPISTIAKTGSNLVYNFGAGTPIPNSPTATHFLVYTKNASGEMATPVALAISDGGGPAMAPSSVSFVDSDGTSGKIAGTVTIGRAASETDVENYYLYWGSSANTKQSGTPITLIAKTSPTITYNFSAGTSIPNSPTATHLLAYSANALGENPNPVSIAISDYVAPPSCSGGGVSVGGSCWYLGSAGSSCDSTCTSFGLTYASATESYAGSAGSTAHCAAVLTALIGSAQSVTDNNSCPTMMGCYYQSGGAGNGRCTNGAATSNAPGYMGTSRACACQ